MNSHQRRIARRLVLRKLQQQATAIRKSWQSTGILIPIIRQLMPTMIARQIVGVQPMTGATGSIFGTRRSKFTMLSERNSNWGDIWYTVECEIEVRNWVVETFSDDEKTLWQEDQDQDVFRSVIDMHEKVYSMLKLRWS